MKGKNRTGWAAGLLMLAVGSCCYAGDAVSGLNGKADISSGSLDGNSGNIFEGSFTFPLGTNFGVQADAFYMDVSSRDFYGAGSHLFWRNSDQGLLGITAAGIRENEVLDSWAGGFEGEYYLNLFARLAQGDNNYDHALAGVRWYFGKQKSLKLRHREDDPPNILNSMMNHIGTYGAEFNQQASEYAAAHGTGVSGGGGYGCVITAIGYDPATPIISIGE